MRRLLVKYSQYGCQFVQMAFGETETTDTQEANREAWELIALRSVTSVQVAMENYYIIELAIGHSVENIVILPDGVDYETKLPPKLGA